MLVKVPDRIGIFILKFSFGYFQRIIKMATKRMIHYSTLSSNSKSIIQSGNLTKMSLHLKKLHLLWIKGSARTKGPLKRHVIAMKHCINPHMKKLKHFLQNANDTMYGTTFMQGDNSSNTSSVHYNTGKEDVQIPPHWRNDRDTLSKRWMTHKKSQQLNTRKKAKAVDSLNQVIYKHYYQKLTRLTKMTVDPVNPPYIHRAMARSAGYSPECNTLSYEQKFRILLHKVNLKWKPRDYIRRKCDFRSLFSQLCTNIVDCIRKCTSNDKGDRLDSMERLDNLFRILRRFKISSQTFRKKVVYRGGGPKKRFKSDDRGFESWGKRDVIGEDQLSVPVIDKMAEILRKQFKLGYGLLNVKHLYRASRTSGQIPQRLKRYNLKSVPIGSHAVQIHFCNDHYVTSEQRPSGVVVWDSIRTSENFKSELFSQLQLTYEILNQYSEPPKGLITYKTDTNNMQEDYNSCGIFAVLRAYFILSHKSTKINTTVARSYLSHVLEKHTFTNYEMFSSNYSSNKMDMMMENYMHNQTELQSTKLEDTASGSSKSVPISDTKSFVRKRGRPQKYSEEEKKQKKRESRLRSYHKTKVCSTGIKRGRPVQYTPEEKELKVRENKLRCYHKKRGSKPPLPPKSCSPPMKRLKHKNQMNLLRSNVTYRETEMKNDRQWHSDRRQDEKYREAERIREKQWHKDKRENEAFREVCTEIFIDML